MLWWVSGKDLSFGSISMQPTAHSAGVSTWNFSKLGIDAMVCTCPWGVWTNAERCRDPPPFQNSPSGIFVPIFFWRTIPPQTKRTQNSNLVRFKEETFWPAALPNSVIVAVPLCRWGRGSMDTPVEKELAGRKPSIWGGGQPSPFENHMLNQTFENHTLKSFFPGAPKAH